VLQKLASFDLESVGSTAREFACHIKAEVMK
jgi:hypothetical protein